MDLNSEAKVKSVKTIMPDPDEPLPREACEILAERAQAPIPFITEKLKLGWKLRAGMSHFKDWGGDYFWVKLTPQESAHAEMTWLATGEDFYRALEKMEYSVRKHSQESSRG